MLLVVGLGVLVDLVRRVEEDLGPGLDLRLETVLAGGQVVLTTTAGLFTLNDTNPGLALADSFSAAPLAGGLGFGQGTAAGSGRSAGAGTSADSGTATSGSASAGTSAPFRGAASPPDA